MTMNTKCKRVRFRVISRTRDEAFAVRMHNGQLTFMSINPATFKETGRNDQNCSRDFKNFEDFQVNRSAMAYWKELRRPS